MGALAEAEAWPRNNRGKNFIHVAQANYCDLREQSHAAHGLTAGTLGAPSSSTARLRIQAGIWTNIGKTVPSACRVASSPARQEGQIQSEERGS